MKIPNSNSYSCLGSDCSYNSDMDLSCCIICLSDIGQSPHCTMVPCGHRFHTMCIQPWLVQKGDCPICRSTVSCCQHGHLGAHDTPVLVSIIDTQRDTIQSLQRDTKIAEESNTCLRMQIAIIMESFGDLERKYELCQLLMSRPLWLESVRMSL
jgi:hypothetical protein